MPFPPVNQGTKVNPANLRVGLGHDTHRLKEGGPLRLGGIDIEHSKSLDGHSDADVLLHAITDAILGAANLGDIGEMFPNTDEANKGRDSVEMLRLAAERVTHQGWSIINLDCVVFAQKPKLMPFRNAIQDRIAGVLGVTADRVGLKGKTGESVGPVGNEEIMMAECVALLFRSDSIE